MNDPEIDCGVAEHRLKSWEDFGTFIATSHSDNNVFIYRGQGDATWRIESTLDRLERRFPTKKGPVGRNFNRTPATRGVHLEAFKEAVRGKRGPSPHELSENEWWALAQHHGLATPLLDWSYSPFVALFFAFEEEGFINPIEKKFYEPSARTVCVIPFHLITKNATKEQPSPSIFSPRREITNRLGSQSGVFMNMPKGTDLEANVRARFPTESSKSDLNARAILTRIVIPNEGRTSCLKFLNKMNINRMSLFPDLDGASQFINALWELNFDTPLGQLPDGQSKDAK